MEKSFFDLPVRDNIRTYDNTRYILTGQGDDYATGYFLDYNYFKEHYKIIAIDLRKQQEIDSDTRAIQQINFTKNLENQSTIFFIIKEAKETVFYFPICFAQTRITLFIFVNNWVIRENESFLIVESCCHVTCCVEIKLQYFSCKYIFICAIYTLLMQLISAILYDTC